MTYQPTINTVIFVALFLVIYMVWLLRNTVRNALDLYDFMLLSACAIVPAAFVFSPALARAVSKVLGVEFPLVVMFGALFLITFVYLYRLVVKSNEYDRTSAVLVQETGLLRLEVRTLRGELEEIRNAGRSA